MTIALVGTTSATNTGSASITLTYSHGSDGRGTASSPASSRITSHLSPASPVGGSGDSWVQAGRSPAPRDCRSGSTRTAALTARPQSRSPPHASGQQMLVQFYEFSGVATTSVVDKIGNLLDRSAVTAGSVRLPRVTASALEVWIGVVGAKALNSFPITINSTG